MNTCPKKCTFFDFVARHRLIWLLMVSIVGISADQVTKIWAQRELAEPYEMNETVLVNGESSTLKKQLFYPAKVLTVVPHVFNLIYKENPAAAFSITHSLPAWFRRPLLIGVSILATIFFLFWYFRVNQDGLLLASFSLILAGAIGNLLDRIRLGYVIDFLDLYAGIFGYPHLHWPTFNVADSMIVIGAIGVIFRTIWPLKLQNEPNSQA